MANRITEIENIFSSHRNYLMQVGRETILFEISSKDSLAKSFRRMYEKGELNNEKLRNNLLLYLSLGSLEKSLEEYLQETLRHFFLQLDIPATQAVKREYFLRYYNKLKSISHNISKLMLYYVPEDFGKIDAFCDLTTSNFKKHFENLEFNAPKNWDTLIADAEIFNKAQVEFSESIGDLLMQGLAELTEEEIHFLKFTGYIGCINMAATNLLVKNAELLEKSGKIKFENGFPTLILSDDELNDLLETISKEQEQKRQEVLKNAQSILLENLSILNGYHKNQKKFIEDSEFKRLSIIAISFFIERKFTLNHPPIANTNISSSSIRYTFYRLREELSPYIDIDKSRYIDFLYNLFPTLFENTERSTLEKKFTDRAPKNYPE